MKKNKFWLAIFCSSIFFAIVAIIFMAICHYNNYTVLGNFFNCIFGLAFIGLVVTGSKLY